MLLHGKYVILPALLAALSLCAQAPASAQGWGRDRDALDRHRPPLREGGTDVTSILLEGADIPEGIETIQWDGLDEEVRRIEEYIENTILDESPMVEAEPEPLSVPEEFRLRNAMRLGAESVMSRNALMLPYESQVVPELVWFNDTHRKATAVILKRFSRYEETFREIFRKAGVPQDLCALCIVESGVNARAESPVGALGMWQFMEETAVGCGLKVDLFTDERLDPVKSARAAARLLRAEFNRFRSWKLAVAAYNCGPGNVQKAIEKAGTSRYDDLSMYLPQETQRYVPRLVAAIYCTYFFENN